MNRRNMSLLAVPLTVLLSAGAWAQHGMPPAGVHVAPVKMESLEAQRLVTGELRAVSRSLVASREAGIITERPIDEGQAVRKGDVLARVDARRLEIDRRRITARKLVAEAILGEREANRDRAQRDYDLILGLDQSEAARPNELANAESDLRVAQARWAQAQEELGVISAEADLIEQRLADAVIRAPFDGVVVAIATELGQWLGEGAPVAELVATGEYDAWIDVQQRFKPALSEAGASVLVSVDPLPGHSVEAAPRIIPQVDSTGRAFQAVVRLPDPEGLMAPGMSVTGWVPTGQKGEYLTVPRDALLRNQADFYVYVARQSPDGPAMAQPVTVIIEFELPDRLAVRSPMLQPGDLVVVEGNERLFPMTPIMFENPAGEEGAGGPDGDGG